MAKHFSQSDIDEFSDCVGLFAKDAKAKVLGNSEELSRVMRSLGFSPTSEEIEIYYKKYNKDDRIEFASFLEIMYEHSQREKCQQEIMAAFQAHDKHKRGTVPSQELFHILTNFGEKISAKEVELLFKEAGVGRTGEVPYNNIVSTLLTPLPDYGS